MFISGMHFDPIILIITVVVMIVSFVVSRRLKSKFKKYSQTPLASGLSGKEIAEMMLRDHGIHDVVVKSVGGELSDHYNPANKTVNLSAEVYQGRNAAAAAVASHECGHAVQHATAYSMLELRSTLVPIQNVSAKILNFLMIAFMFGGYFFMRGNMQMFLGIYLACYAVFTLFSLVTLPVEFDASNRALAWISQKGIVTREEYGQSKDALKWAALTYVVAALGTLATFLYYLSMFMGGSDD